MLIAGEGIDTEGVVKMTVKDEFRIKDSEGERKMIVYW